MRTHLHRIIPSLAGVLALVPFTAEAKSFKQVVDTSIVPLGDLVITLLYGAATILFLFGVLRYFFVSGASAEEGRQKGKQHMFWGIIALVVLFSVWGLVRILLNLLKEWSV